MFTNVRLCSDNSEKMFPEKLEHLQDLHQRSVEAVGSSGISAISGENREKVLSMISRSFEGRPVGQFKRIIDGNGQDAECAGELGLKSGGSGGARTRNLCRDRAAL